MWALLVLGFMAHRLACCSQTEAHGEAAIGALIATRGKDAGSALNLPKSEKSMWQGADVKAYLIRIALSSGAVNCGIAIWLTPNYRLGARVVGVFDMVKSEMLQMLGKFDQPKHKAAFPSIIGDKFLQISSALAVVAEISLKLDDAWITIFKNC